MQNSMQIATTIRNQIRAIDPNAMMAWGATQLIAMRDGLKFKTSGLVRWKGYVYIQYDEGQDLYNVIFAKVRKLEWKVTKQVDGVFFDQLVEIIDRQVG
jgi:hypothetical protein